MWDLGILKLKSILWDLKSALQKRMRIQFCPGIADREGWSVISWSHLLKQVFLCFCCKWLGCRGEVEIFGNACTLR